MAPKRYEEDVEEFTPFRKDVELNVNGLKDSSNHLFVSFY